MAGISLLHAIFALLCMLVTLFYFIRLVNGRRWLGHFDGENEGGHGLMALGMVFILAPAGSFSSDFLRWSIVVFAVAALWWTLRLFVRKPVLALLDRKNSVHSTVQADAIHIFMHGCMCYMFLLMSSMALSMTFPATSASSLCVVVVAYLAFFYSRECARDCQAVSRDWLQLGANLAHALMSGMMGWMFLEMLTMTMRIGAL